MKVINLTEDQFDSQFNTELNEVIESEDCAFDGCLYETYGIEHEFILSIANDVEKNKHLWTIIESDDNDNIYYLNGYHIVNRLGFLITKEPWEDNAETIVTIEFNSDEL